MSTQKAKFELFSRLQSLGFTYDEAAALRRIEMTLHRWAELECGDGDDWKSWCIARDEETGVPYMEAHPHTGKMHRYKIADRERGALKRLKAIVDARNARITAIAGRDLDTIIPYHQGDPRGCALYLVRNADLGQYPIEQVYTRGLAVAA